jgi:hypothetical protein
MRWRFRLTCGVSWLLRGHTCDVGPPRVWQHDLTSEVLLTLEVYVPQALVLSDSSIGRAFAISNDCESTADPDLIAYGIPDGLEEPGALMSEIEQIPQEARLLCPYE